MFKFIFESIKKMTIKLISDITLTLTFFPRYNFYNMSQEEALKIVEVLSHKKQTHDQTRICTTKDSPNTDVPTEQ